MQQIIGFDIADIHYGIEACYIEEVLQSCLITPLPCAPKGIRGMAHYQGLGFPVLDPAVILDQVVENEHSCLILIHVDGHHFFLNLHTIPYYCEEGSEIMLPDRLTSSPVPIDHVLQYQDHILFIFSAAALFQNILDSFRDFPYPW